MTLEASDKVTGVEAVQTDPAQWLKTTVDVVGCQVIRNERSSPRISESTTDRVLASSTTASMARPRLDRHRHVRSPSWHGGPRWAGPYSARAASRGNRLVSLL